MTRNPLPIALAALAGKLASWLGAAVTWVTVDAAVEELTSEEGAPPPTGEPSTWHPVSAIVWAWALDRVRELRAELATAPPSPLAQLATSMGAAYESRLRLCSPAPLVGVYGLAVCQQATTTEEVVAAVATLASHVRAARGGALPAVRVAGHTYGDEGGALASADSSGSGAGVGLALALALIGWLLWRSR